MAGRNPKGAPGERAPDGRRATARQKALAWFIAILMLFSVLGSLGSLLVME